MNRKGFLKRIGLGALVIPAIVTAGKSDDEFSDWNENDIPKKWNGPDLYYDHNAIVWTDTITARGTKLRIPTEWGFYEFDVIPGETYRAWFKYDGFKLVDRGLTLWPTP